MPDDPSVYGSYMNFFLPPSARVPGMPAGPPGLYDMLGNMGMSGWGQPGTPEEQRRRQQQQMAMAQQGLKMMQPQQAAPTPPPLQGAPQQPPPGLPPATEVTPSTEPSAPVPPAQARYDPRDPRRRNAMAGTPNPFGGYYR